jgi:ribosomal-protein-alanine N-acetyltransferase
MELHTARLLMREFVETDAPWVNAYESDPEVVRYATHGLRSLADSLERIRLSVEESSAVPRTLFDLALVRRDNARLIGRSGLKITTSNAREAMLWYVLDRAEWGQGYAPEAAGSLLAFAFDELQLHRVFVDIDARHVASLRVAQKLGMRREAHFLEHVWIKGEWADTVICAVLAREYRAQRLPLA